MKYLAQILYLFNNLLCGGLNRFLRYFYKYLFKSCGDNVKFSPLNSSFSYRQISIGDDVYIGPNACFSSIKEIRIGNKVLFGPGVHIHGGNHNTSVVGRYIFDVTEKNPDDDAPVIIDDVWIGSGAIILKNVTIGRCV